MPRGGSKPGEHRGGRKKGTRNKTTVERALMAEHKVSRAAAQGKQLAKEHLDTFLHLFVSMAAYYQPTLSRADDPMPPNRNPNGNEAKFQEWACLAVDVAHKLAPYQSPTFRAVIVAPAPEQRGELVKRFTLNIFSSEERPLPRLINGGGESHP